MSGYVESFRRVGHIRRMLMAARDCLEVALDYTDRAQYDKDGEGERANLQAALDAVNAAYDKHMAMVQRYARRKGSAA